MVLNSQKTIYATDSQMSAMLEDSYVPKLNTLLNEKFNLYPNDRLPTGVFPKLKYFAIGVGGNNIITGANGYNYSQHNPTDAALFEHIPFIMRPVEIDLLPSERAQYRMRVEETYNSVLYACYYLRLTTAVDVNSSFYKISNSADKNTLSLFSTNTDTLLNPIPVDRSITIADFSTSEYIAKLVKFEFSLNTNDLAELANVLSILGKEDKKLTEIGMCLGGDATYGAFQEAISVQIGYHIGVDIDLALTIANNGTILRAIELGGSEPLIMK